MTLERAQAALDDLKAVCAKHKIALVGVSDEGFSSDVLLVDESALTHDEQKRVNKIVVSGSPSCVQYAVSSIRGTP